MNKVIKRLKNKLQALKRESTGIITERKVLANKLANIISAIEKGVLSDSLTQKLTDYEERIRELDARTDMLNQAYDFDKLKVDEAYVTGWLDKIRELLNTDVMAAKAKIIALIGEFVLSPETIDGIRYLRFKGNARLERLLTVAVGKRSFPIRGILGGQFSVYCS